jgi:hypothetical protein
MSTIQYQLIFITNKVTRKGPSFDSKEIAIEYGEKVCRLYGCTYKIETGE